MPLYEFRCQVCGERFEAVAAPSDRSSCPRCCASETERIYSAFAGPFTVGLKGAAARRSNAQRRVREELRQEGFREQREQRKQREQRQGE